MMELFLLEHKKLWRKTSTKISVFLCFLYLVVFGSILSFQWFSFGSSDEYTSAFGNNFDGYDMIRKRQEYSLMFGGELTDQSLQKMVGDYQNIGAAGVDRKLEKTDMHIINSWLGTLYLELYCQEDLTSLLSIRIETALLPLHLSAKDILFHPRFDHCFPGSLQ